MARIDVFLEKIWPRATETCTRVKKREVTRTDTVSQSDTWIISHSLSRSRVQWRVTTPCAPDRLYGLNKTFLYYKSVKYEYVGGRARLPGVVKRRDGARGGAAAGADPVTWLPLRDPPSRTAVGKLNLLSTYRPSHLLLPQIYFPH